MFAIARPSRLLQPQPLLSGPWSTEHCSGGATRSEREHLRLEGCSQQGRGAEGRDLCRRDGV